MPVPILFAVIFAIAFLQDLLKESKTEAPPKKTDEEALGEAIARLLTQAQQEPEKQ